MDGNVWRPTHLTSEQMEERRLAAARLLRQGQLSQADIARHVEGSRACVCRWAAAIGHAAHPVLPSGRGQHDLPDAPLSSRATRAQLRDSLEYSILMGQFDTWAF
jgi:hypothetical protein